MIKKSLFLFWMLVLLPIPHIAEAQNLDLQWIPQLEVADPLLSTDSLPPVAFNSVPEKRKRRKFSIGLTRSYYKPSLKELNQILANPKRVIIQDPNHRLPTNPEFQSESRNVSMDKIGGDMTLGIEAELHLNHRNGLVISFSEWEGETARTDLIPILLSPGDPAVSVPRQIRYNLKLKQLFLTWRYAFFDVPKRGRLYLDLGFLGMSYATFEAEAFLHVENNPVGAAFHSRGAMTAKGRGFTSRVGLGGEVFLRPWLSLALNIHYLWGKVKDLSVESYTTPNFGILQGGFPGLSESDCLPQIGGNPTGQTLESTTCSNDQDIGGNPRPVTLRLDGLEGQAAMRFHF